MVNYWAMRTDKLHSKEILKEIDAGRLRQGWGYADDQDLRQVHAIWNRNQGDRSKLSSSQEETVRHLAFLGADEPGMMRAGDIVLIPNLPDRERFVLCKLTSNDYQFSYSSYCPDHGHIRNVELLTKKGVVKYSAAVHSSLHATLRTPMRLWSLNAYEEHIKHVMQKVDSADTQTILGNSQRISQLKQNSLDIALDTSVSVGIDKLFEGTGYEHLLVNVLPSLFRVKIEHTGGPTEKGADIVVRIQHPFSHQGLLVLIQVKHHQGNTGTEGLEQLRVAIESRRTEGNIALAVLATTGSVDETLKNGAKTLERDTGVPVQICAEQHLQRLLRRGLLLSALNDAGVEAEEEL